MSAAYTIRDAVPADAADLAILDNVASHGFSQWFWQGAVIQGKAEDAYAWGRSRFADRDAIFGWKNARVIADENDIIAGALNSYLMPDEEVADEMSEPEEFRPVLQLFLRAAGDWFVDSLAVYPDCRGQGLGRMLLDDCISRGQKAGHQTISLVAEDANPPAIALYESRGFKTVEARPYIPFTKHSTSQNWLLMKAPLH
ncbi:MAG: N-acetyltransferase [Pseudomonadota bacterium]